MTPDAPERAPADGPKPPKPDPAADAPDPRLAAREAGRAARDLARGRRWATLLISENPIAEGAPSAVAASLDEAAPHLDEPERAALQHAYLGNLTWEAACEATGIPFSALPDTA